MVAEMKCGSDLEVSSGRDERVETQSSGYNVPSHAEWATWMCLWMCNCGIPVAVELIFRGVDDESRIKTRIEMGSRISKRLFLPLGLYIVANCGERGCVRRLKLEGTREERSGYD